MHQFDKVEMFSFVAPEDSPAEHERILAIEEEVLQALGLPYRVMNIAVGELGNSAAKKYDCEAWLPSQERYRELTSCSNTTDYQARRLNIRARRERPGGGRSVETVHTLNGTAVAVGRTILALLENGQQQDGSVRAARRAGALRRARADRRLRRPVVDQRPSRARAVLGADVEHERARGAVRGGERQAVGARRQRAGGELAAVVTAGGRDRRAAAQRVPAHVVAAGASCARASRGRARGRWR